MPFLRPLSETAPNGDPTQPWPIHGLAYVSAFMGPMSAGPLIGLLARDWLAAVVGLGMGVAISLLAALLSDRFVDRWVASHRRALQQRSIHLLVNVAAFGWAVALCVAAMLAPLALYGSEILTRIR